MPGEAQHSVTENTASPLDLSRRDFVATASAVAGGFALAPGSARAATVGTDIANLPPYGNGTLPPGIRSRPIANVNGLTVHILEAGHEVPGRPAVLLLLAAAEYHVIAPDQRGYGRTTGWDDSYDADPDLSASSTWSAMPWDSCSRSAIARWRAWLGTMLARRSRRGARSSGRMYFDR